MLFGSHELYSGLTPGSVLSAVSPLLVQDSLFQALVLKNHSLLSSQRSYPVLCSGITPSFVLRDSFWHGSRPSAMHSLESGLPGASQRFLLWLSLWP